MFARPRLQLISLALAFAAVSPASGDPPAPNERAARTDLYGDPLPEFVRARLGTVRFRHGAPVGELRFAPDGRTVLSHGADRVARLWETATGKEHRHFSTPDEGRGWILTPDLRTLITSAHGLEIRVLDTVTSKQVRTLSSEGYVLSNPCLTPDGKTLAATAIDRNTGKRAIRLWDLTTGRELRDIVPGPVGENKKDFGLMKIALSADGKVLTAWGEVENQWACRLWDLAGAELGKEPLLPQEGGKRHPLTMPALSPDAKVLAMATEDPAKGMTLSLLDTLTGKKLRDLDPPVTNLSNLFFAPDGRTLFAVEDEARLHVWDLATGRPLPAPVLGQDEYLIEAAFTPDCRTAAFGTGEHTIHVCDVRSGKTLHTLKGYQGAGRGDLPLRFRGRFIDPDQFGDNTQGGTLVFSPDGRLLAGAGEGGVVRLWNVADGKPVGPATVGHEGGVASLAASPDGKALTSMSVDGTVRVWELAGVRQLRALTVQAEAANQPVHPRCVSFSPDGRGIAVGAFTVEDLEGFVQLWDAATGKPGPRLKTGSAVLSLAFSPDGRRLATGELGAVSWLDAATGRPMHRFVSRREADPERDPELPQVATISPDGRLLAVAGNMDGSTFLWETGTGQLRSRLTPAIEDPTALLERRQMGMSRLWRDPIGMGFPVAFAPDSKLLAAAQYDAIQLWDVASGRELRQCGIPGGEISGMAFAPNAGLLAACSEIGLIRIWDFATGTLRAELRAERGGFQSLAFSPDGKTLFTGGSDTTVLLWDVDRILKESRPAPRSPTGKELEELWNRLANLKDSQVGEAMSRLQAAPQLAVPFVRERLRPAAPLDTRRISQLLDELGDERFEVRQRATEELEKLAEMVEPILRRRLKEDPPLEARQRIEQVLEGLAGFASRPEQVQALRAVEVLERIGTPEAQEALQALAKGAPEARLTQEAKAALERLIRRAAVP